MTLTSEQCDRFINMRLYQARVLLDQVAEQDIDNMLYQALLHACVHQLNSAVIAIVARISTQFAFDLDQNALMGGSAKAVKLFEAELNKRDRQSGELNELLQLQESGWLKDLDQAYCAFYDISSPFTEQRQAQNSQLIMTDVSEQTKPLSESCRLWLTEIKALLNRHREASVEW